MILSFLFFENALQIHHDSNAQGLETRLPHPSVAALAQAVVDQFVDLTLYCRSPGMIESLELFRLLVLSRLSQVGFIGPHGNGASGPGGRGALMSTGTGLTGGTGKGEDVRIFGARTGSLRFRESEILQWLEQRRVKPRSRARIRL